MIQVAITCTVGENGAEGSIINVILAETIPASHDDTQALFLQVGLAIERLGHQVVSTAKDQSQVWSQVNKPFG